MNEAALIPVTLTEEAIAQVKRQIAKKGSGTSLRLSTKPTGCTGWSYVVEIVEAPLEKDCVFRVEDGLSVCVDSASYERVKGTEIDYVREGVNERFMFENPNVKDTCGCGESFNV